MYILYMDESGDPGFNVAEATEERRASVHYVLSGIIIPITEWRTYLNSIVEIKRNLKKSYGIPIRVELKGSELINPRKNKFLKTMNRLERTKMYFSIFQEITSQFNKAYILNIATKKEQISINKYKDIQETTWRYMIDRYNIFLKKNSSFGIVISDDTNEPKLRKLIRKMRVYNPVNSHYTQSIYNATVNQIIEDPFCRNSEHSFFIQIADLISHSLYRKLYPKGSYKRYNVDKIFDSLDSILLKEANKKNEQGIVFL